MKRNSFMGKMLLWGICTMALTACSSGGSDDNITVNDVENVDVETTQYNSNDTETIQDNNSTVETIQDKNDVELMSDNNSVLEMDSGKSDKECRCEYPYQHDYAEYLNVLDFYQGIYIGDINDDEIPEMIIDINDYGSYQLLYYTKDGIQMRDLETVSAWGAVTWIADTKQFIHCPFFGHTIGTWGYIEYYVFDWNGTANAILMMKRLMQQLLRRNLKKLKSLCRKTADCPRRFLLYI